MSSKAIKSVSNQSTRSNTISENTNANIPQAKGESLKESKAKIFNYYYLFDECNMLKIKPTNKKDKIIK